MNDPVGDPTRHLVCITAHELSGKQSMNRTNEQSGQQFDVPSDV
jgi:hypothetical protein